jgi:hypothetical protein
VQSPGSYALYGPCMTDENKQSEPTSGNGSAVWHSPQPRPPSASPVPIPQAMEPAPSGIPSASACPFKVAALALVLGMVGGIAVGRYLVPEATDSVKAKVAAIEFCALGDGDGASLLEVAGWAKGAQRVNDDWNAVLSEISDRCESWRQQVAAKADDLGN